MSDHSSNLDRLAAHFRPLDVLGYLAPGAIFWVLLLPTSRDFIREVFLQARSIAGEPSGRVAIDILIVLMAFMAMYTVGFLLSHTVSCLTSWAGRWPYVGRVICGSGNEYKSIYKQFESSFSNYYAIDVTKWSQVESQAIAEWFARADGLAGGYDRALSMNRFACGIFGAVSTILAVAAVRYFGFGFPSDKEIIWICGILSLLSLLSIRGDSAYIANEAMSAGLVSVINRQKGSR